MKILIITNNGGGLYLFRRALVERLVAEGHRVSVSVPEDEFTERLRTLGCRIEPLPSHLMVRRGMNPLTDIRLYRQYRKLLHDRKPDLVLTYTIKPNIYGTHACQKEQIPYISTVTGLGNVFMGDSFFKKILRGLVVRLFRISLKDCSCLFFQNDANRDTYASYGIRAKKTRIVNGSGVELGTFPEQPMPAAGNGREGTPVRFAFVSRIMREKGIEEFLQAAAHVKKHYPLAQFDVCGIKEPEYKGRLDVAVQKGIVQYRGEVRDMPAYLKEIHCVVIPILFHEGMNNALQEAAASGRASIASDIPGCREIVEDGVTGLRVPPQDAEALADAMERFLSLSQEARAEMGRQARRKMEREFDRRLVVEAYMEEITQYDTMRRQ